MADLWATVLDKLGLYFAVNCPGPQPRVSAPWRRGDRQKYYVILTRPGDIVGDPCPPHARPVAASLVRCSPCSPSRRGLRQFRPTRHVTPDWLEFMNAQRIASRPRRPVSRGSNAARSATRARRAGTAASGPTSTATKALAARATPMTCVIERAPKERSPE